MSALLRPRRAAWFDGADLEGDPGSAKQELVFQGNRRISAACPPHRLSTLESGPNVGLATKNRSSLPVRRGTPALPSCDERHTMLMSALFSGAIQSEPHQLARCRLTLGSAARDGTRRRGGTSPEPASAATAAQCSSAISGCMFPPIGPRSTVTTQSPQASPATMHEPQSITMFVTLGRGSDSRSRRGAQGPPSPAAS